MKHNELLQGMPYVESEKNYVISNEIFTFLCKPVILTYLRR